MKGNQMKNQDEKINQLLKVVEKRKEEIAKDEALIQGRWLTNCMYSLEGKPVHLHTVKDETVLMEVLADVVIYSEALSKSAEILGLANSNNALIKGYTYYQWESDIKKQLATLQLRSKKAKLAEVEAKLNALVSPEMRASKELASIEQYLQD